MVDIVIKGGSAAYNWNALCTHAVVERTSPVTNALIEAVIAKRPIVLCDWLQVPFKFFNFMFTLHALILSGNMILRLYS